MDIQELNAVMTDALLEAGAKREEFGPGIVVRLTAPAWGDPRWVTLRVGDWTPERHLRHRGTFVEDYAASNIDSMTDCRAPSPYAFEEVTE